MGYSRTNSSLICTRGRSTVLTRPFAKTKWRTLYWRPVAITKSSGCCIVR